MAVSDVFKIYLTSDLKTPYEVYSSRKKVAMYFMVPHAGE